MAKLRTAECREFIKAVVEKAEEIGVPISVAVVGPEGHLAVERMDPRQQQGGTRPAPVWFSVSVDRSARIKVPSGVRTRQRALRRRRPSGRGSWRGGSGRTNGRRRSRPAGAAPRSPRITSAPSGAPPRATGRGRGGWRGAVFPPGPGCPPPPGPPVSSYRSLWLSLRGGHGRPVAFTTSPCWEAKLGIRSERQIRRPGGS